MTLQSGLEKEKSIREGKEGEGERNWGGRNQNFRFTGRGHNDEIRRKTKEAGGG